MSSHDTPTVETPTLDAPSDNEAEREAASVPEVDEDSEVVVKKRIAECSALFDRLTKSTARFRGDKKSSQFQEQLVDMKNTREELAELENMLEGLQCVRRLQQRIASPGSVVYTTAPTTAHALSPAMAAIAASAVPTALTSPRVRFPHGLPKFRNGTESIQDPRDFIDQFELIMHGHDLSLDQYWHRFFPCCLPPTIAKWMIQRTPSTCSWGEAKKVFLRQYVSPRALEDARVALSNMQMRSAESISAYTQRFENQMLVAQIADDNELAVARLKDTLPPELRQHIDTAMLGRPNASLSVKELINLALSVFWLPKDARPSPRSAGGQEVAGKHQQSGTHKQKYCQIHGHGHHSTEQCRALQASTSRPKHAGKTSTGITASPAVVHPAAPASTSTVQCYSCNQTGHYASDCPQKQSTASGKRIAQLTAVIPASRADDIAPNRASYGKTDDAIATREQALKAALVVPMIRLLK